MNEYLVVEKRLRKYLKINHLVFIDIDGLKNATLLNYQNGKHSELQIYCSNFFSLSNSNSYPNLPTNIIYGIGIGLDLENQDSLYFLTKETPKEADYKDYGYRSSTDHIFAQREYTNLEYYLNNHNKKETQYLSFDSIIQDYQNLILRYKRNNFDISSISILDNLIESYLDSYIQK